MFSAWAAMMGIRMEFTSPEILNWLEHSDDEAVDALSFGVVRIDEGGRATRYNAYESRQAGLAKAEVLDQVFFDQIAPCMNNRMVAGRFAESRQTESALDTIIDYVLAFRSAITPVQLRLLYSPSFTCHYLLIQRL